MFSFKWDSNDIMFYISDVEGLFNWFAPEFVLFHCSSGHKEKLDFSLKFVKVDPCAVASLLVKLKGIILGVIFLFRSKWKCV